MFIYPIFDDMHEAREKFIEGIFSVRCWARWIPVVPILHDSGEIQWPR